MKKFKKLTAILLVAVMAVACYAFSASAETASVTASVVNGSVKILEDKLALLADGDTVSGATAYGDAGLVAFENTGFTHTDGPDAAVEATFEIVVDLGEVQTIGAISLDCFKDSANMIALPAVKFYASVDGECFYDVNAGNAVSPAEDAPETAVATLTANFSTRIALNARYVKAVATFKNGWAFVSELSVSPAAEGQTGENPDRAHAYTEHAYAESYGIAVFDSTDGELDLSNGDTSTGKHLKNSQLIKAAYEEETGAYKVIYSKVNPYPEGHTGTETLAEGEILVAISTQGTVTADAYSGAKWIARGLVEGDYVVLNGDGTLSFHTEPDFKTSDESSEPEASSEPAASSEAASSEASSDPIQTGDTGIIAFALLAVVAVAGVAIAVKVRN